MLNKIFLNEVVYLIEVMIKCKRKYNVFLIKNLNNYKLIKMDILICSVVLFGYLVLFFFFYVK